MGIMLRAISIFVTHRQNNRNKRCTVLSPLRSGILALCTFGGYTKAVFRIDAGRDYSGCRNSCVRKTKELAVYRGKVRVYDIRNAGRHHRFTVSGRLVHNCGYGGSVGALISMGALDMGLKESELPDLIPELAGGKPEDRPVLVGCGEAAVETVKTHEEHSIKRIRFQYYSGTLWTGAAIGQETGISFSRSSSRTGSGG